jgi:hypothetical protein
MFQRFFRIGRYYGAQLKSTAPVNGNGWYGNRRFDLQVRFNYQVAVQRKRDLSKISIGLRGKAV